MSEYKSGTYIKAAQLILMTTLAVFAVVLIIVNRLLGWEIWMVPVIGVGTFFCWSLQFSHTITERLHIYICGFFLMFLTFYYSVNIKTVYDSTAIVAIMILIFAFTGKRLLALGGLISGWAGMVVHLLTVKQEHGLKLDHSNVIRTIFQFILVLLAYFLVEKIMQVWNQTEKEYLKRLMQLAEENNRANNFLANVSHEIRTPINAVIGLSAVIRQEPLSDHVRDNVEAISDAGHRVAEQIGDILDFTEIDMKRLAVSDESYIINSLVNDLMSQLTFAETYGLALVIDIEAGIPYELVGDGTKIKRILWHLISNGFKFTKDGGVYVHLFPVKRAYGINLVMEVKDTGVGMEEEEIEHVYEKFYQSDGSRSRTVGGLGLGIPIANGFAQAMGGVIAIDSVPDEGTTVRVSIPQKVLDPTPCYSVRDRENCVVAGFLGFMTTGHLKIREYYMAMISHLVASLSVPFHRVQSAEELMRLLETTHISHLFVGTGEYLENREYIDSLSKKLNVALVVDLDFKGEVSSGITLMPKPFYGVQVANFLNQMMDTRGLLEEARISCPGLRALVVDDEPMNLLVARGIFESYGMVVTTVPGGQEAIDICEQEDFDIIFMDHMMPGMDGVEAMKRLRVNASKDRKELCIVALTANAISSAKEMFLSEGFDGFVPKPIDISDLDRVLKRVLPKSAIVYDEGQMSPPQAPAPEASKQEAADAPAEDSLSVLQNFDVDIEKGILYCRGDRDFYQELLLEYAKERDRKVSELEAFLADENLADYAIRVHAVKSTSKMIGAMDLSEAARKLELAAKGGDLDFVKAHHPGFLPRYDALMDEINVLLGKAGKAEAPEETTPGEPEVEDDEDEFVLEFDPEGGDL